MQTKQISLSTAAFSSLAFLALAACSNPADNVPAAQVSSSTNSASSAPAPSLTDANSRNFAFGGQNSKIGFVGSKVTGSHEGGFTNFAGQIKLADGKPVGSGTRVVIATDSLWSDNGRLTGHLKSPDFFDVAKFPTAVFQSSSFSPQGTNWNVTGDLTLHGVTKQISFPAQIQLSAEKVSVDAEFAINRFDFEMKYPGKADDLIRKEVVLKLDIDASPGQADFGALEKAPAPSAPSAGY